MGCKNSQLNKKVHLEESDSENYVPPIPEHRIQLTQRQKELVRETWKLLQADIAKVGVVVFMGLFKKHPDAKDIFVPLKGKTDEELEKSIQLREHGLNVMGAVEKVIARLDQPQNIETMLYQLGKRHTKYNVKIDYFDIIIQHFIDTIKPTIKDAWTNETEEAWVAFFNLIISIMKESLLANL